MNTSVIIHVGYKKMYNNVCTVCLKRKNNSNNKS